MNRKPRQSSSPEITLLAGFGLAFALLLVTSIAQRRSIQQLIETDAWVAHSRQVRTELEGAHSAIQRGESGTRGYVVTGEQDYLGQQQAGIDRAQQHLQSLRDLTADNPRQVRNYEKLSELAQRKIAMMHYLTALRRNRGFPAAEEFLATEEPLQLMNEIRAQVDLMEAEEAALLERRQAASEADAQRSKGAVALGTLLAIAVLLASGWNVRRDWLKRRRAEQALCRSVADLKQAQRVARLGSWSMDVKTGYVTWSEELYRMLGLDASPQAPSYAEHRRLFTPESWERLAPAVENTVRRGTPYELELETVRPDGSTGWMLARGEAVRDAGGAITGLRGIAQDITDRKRAEEIRSRLAAIVESSAVAIESINLDGVITSWNPGAERLYGFSAEEAIGQPISIIAPPELPGDVEGTLRRIVQNQEVRHLETTRLRKDGSRVSVAATISPVRDATGRIVGASSVSFDITERKRAEERLRKLNRALKTISECNQALVQEQEEKALLERICGILVREGGYRLAWVGYAEEDEARSVRPVAQAGADEGYLAGARISWADNERGRGPTGKAIRFGAPFVARQAAAEPEYDPWRAEAVRRGFASSVALPLTANGAPMGALTAYSGEPDAFDEDELKLLGELANDLAYGIQALRTRAEHQRAERALQESEAAFRTLANAMPQMVWMCMPDGMNVYFNDRWVEYTGLTLEESYGRGWNTPFHPDDKQAAWDAWNHATATGDIYQIESRLRAADGSYRWFLMRGVPMRDAGGQIVKWFGTCTDIEDLKRTEEALRQTSAALLEAKDRTAAERQRFNNILDVMPAYVVLLSADYHVPFANRYFEERFGKSQGKRCFEYLFGRAEPCEVCHTYEVLDTKAPLQWFWTGPDGRDYDIHDYPFTDSDGSTLILEMGIDITEQNRAQAALRESQRRLELARKAGRVGVWEWIPARGEIFWGPGSESLYGLPAGGFGDDYQAWRCTVHPDDIEMVERELRAALENNTVYQAEFRAAWPDGSVHWLFGRGEVIGDEGGATRMLGVNVDITERKAAEEALRELNATLERRVAERTAQLAAVNRELEAFSYSVAHDLRAPLRAIDGFSLALLEDFGPKLEPEAQDDLSRVRKATVRMGELIDDLLHLSRISRAEVRREKVDLRALAQTIVSDLQKTAPERPLEFVSPPSLEAEGDPSLLRVVLENLLGNAWKFTAPRLQARIELGSVEHEGRTAYFVRDNGAGFDMAYANKLFAPFQRLHSAADFPGMGIGLATVARIVRKHGGEVWAEGAVDKGAAFYFTLREVDS